MEVLPLHRADSSRSKGQIPGLDAVRALAALGVVLLHSCVPYLQHPMPGLVWSTRDASSGLVDFGFWTIELFIMPLFLVLAGIFAWKTLAQRGVRKLVKSRARRLLIPLLFGMVVVLPLDLYSWVLGWVADGVVAPVKLRSLKFDDAVDRQLWGLSHLWFLQYLFLYVVAVAAAVTFAAWARMRFAGVRRFVPRRSITVIALLATATLVVYLRPEVVWGFQHSFFPVPSKWIFSGIFFAFGLAIGAWDGDLAWLTRISPRMVIPAVAVSIAAVILGRWHLSGGDNELAHVTLAALTACGSLLVTLSIIGMAAARIGSVSNRVQYIAAASFWVYLVHHPIVGLVHTDLKWMMVDASPALKTVLAFGVTSGVCLLTYEGLVRRTALGRMLGFAWQPATADAAPLEPTVSIETRRSEPAEAPGRRAA